MGGRHCGVRAATTAVVTARVKAAWPMAGAGVLGTQDWESERYRLV